MEVVDQKQQGAEISRRRRRSREHGRTQLPQLSVLADYAAFTTLDAVSTQIRGDADVGTLKAQGGTGRFQSGLR